MILRTRLDELDAADTLEQMRHIPQANCHELSQNRKGQIAVNLAHPYRLIFRPGNDPIPTKSDGGLDWTKVNVIEVSEISDYH